MSDQQQNGFSCQVKVLHVIPQDYGGQAKIEYHEGGGIDLMPGPFVLAITEDSARLVKPGAILTLTLNAADA